MMLEIVEEDLSPGRAIGGFVLEKPLGAGGMGVVWSARDAGAKKSVALKFLRTDREIGEKERARFLREARASMAIAHPHVAKVHAVQETETGAPYLVMDLLEGESLREVLRRRGALTIAECVRVFVPIASALEAAHALGIVHRDLKPENVFLVHGHDVRVLDFGIAKHMPRTADGTASASLTSTGAVLGTPQYMAPEQVFGDENLDGRADAWAIGIMLFECLAGRRPIDGIGFGPIIKGITVDPIPPLTLAHGGEAPELVALVHRLLSRDRAARPSLAEVRAVLIRSDNANVPTRREALHVPEPARPPTTTAAVASKRPQPTTYKADRGSRVPLVLAIVVGTALTAGIAVTAAQLTKGRGPPPLSSDTPAPPASSAVAETTDATPDASPLATEPTDAGKAPRGVVPTTPVEPDSPGARSIAARAALEKRDGATCLREYDAYDRLEKNAANHSTNPQSTHSWQRAMCLMMAGDCEGGKALFKKSRMTRSGASAADAEAAADKQAGELCTGPNMSAYDQMASAGNKLSSAAFSGGATPAQCMQWYNTVRKLAPTVQPRAPGDDITRVPGRLMKDAPKCLAYAGDCAGSFNVFKKEYAVNRPPIADPVQREEDIKGEYRAVMLEIRKCQGTP